MPDKSIYRDCFAQLAISPRTSDKSTRPTSEAFPNNPGTLVQSETNQGTEPKWLDNLSHLLGLSSVRPFGDFATCGAKGIPRVYIQLRHGAAQANVGGPAWDKAPNKTNDMGALQNGAKVFVNYCLNCHSAAFMRYNRLSDIGLTEQQIKDNLLVTNAKVGDTMVAAIDPQQAKAWFGVNPPDLTVIARSRAGAGGSGSDYLYTYMRSFYKDETKPTGWNNLLFPNVAMPHVLWQLQGERRPIYEEIKEHGEVVPRVGNNSSPAA